MGQPSSNEKFSIDNLSRESQRGVLGGNSLKFEMTKNQFHISEAWDYQSSQPRLQRDVFLVESSSNTV